MSFGSVRELVLSINFDVHGVPATMTRDDQAAVTTSLIWQTAPEPEPQPFGGDFTARGPRRVAILLKSVFPDGVERGTLIAAPEVMDGSILNWQVDATDRSEGDHWRVCLVRTT